MAEASTSRQESSKRALEDEEASLSDMHNSNKKVKQSSIHIVSHNVDDPVKGGLIDLQPNKLQFSPNKGKVSPKSLRHFLKRHDFPDFLCLNEVRARSTDKDWISALKAAPNTGSLPGEPLYNTHLSLCQTSKGPRRFGVAVYVTKNSQLEIQKVRQVDWDHEGRVIVVEMPKWTLFAVYALNSSEYEWKDPLNPARATGMTRSQRKRQFQEKLMAEAATILKSGREVVLIGDFNVTLTKMDCTPRLRVEEPHATNRRLWIEQFTKIGLVDIFRHQQPNERQYSWFAKGKPQGEDCARVDYALLSAGIIPNVTECVYWQSPTERGYSDHAPISLKFNGF